MKDSDYYKSQEHKANAATARILATSALKLKAETRKNAYLQNPKLCEYCLGAIPYDKQVNRFCRSTCSAGFNNRARKETGWKRTEESKTKTSASLEAMYAKLTVEQKVERYKNNNSGHTKPLVSMYANLLVFAKKKKASPRQKTGNGVQRGRVEKQPDVVLTCNQCGKLTTFPYIKRGHKTCGSDDCKVQASVGCRTYQNGSRKPVWFFNPNENKEVLLDSSWEVTVANKLIELNIKWTRPKFIKWIDSTGTTRRYFPDFHLTDYGLYLDPKNPYCMVKDKEKLEIVSKQTILKYGSLETILDYITELKNMGLSNGVTGLPCTEIV